MNRKKKRLLAVMLLCTMVCFAGSSVLAAKKHVCTYGGTIREEISNIHVGSHNYKKYNSSTQKIETHICQMRQIVYDYKDICECGAVLRTNRVWSVQHSSCGQ